MTTIKPTLSVPIFDGEVTVHAFGRKHGVNFSFKGIDESRDPQATHGHLLSALTSINKSNADFYAPSPVMMNAVVVESTAMINCRAIHMNGRDSEILYRGIHADGFGFVNLWNSYAVSAADCALIVVQHGDKILAAHAGRDSVIDMGAMKGQAHRPQESVVYAIRNKLKQRQKSLAMRDVRVWVGFSISPGPHFAHAKNDEKNPHNRTMVEYIIRRYGPSCFKEDGQGGALGWLDTKELIRRQCLSLGIQEKCIEFDSVCTYSDTNPQGEHLWYSNRRQTLLGEKQHRNLFAVVKTA